MPVINGVYLKDFTALPSSVTDANIIPIAITGNQVAYRTTVGGIVTDARVTSKLLTGLSVTGGAIAATDTILQAFGKVQNQINSKVSSVGLTMPSAFNVANSPITSAGTLAVTAIGAASQYIRGDGALADFPTSGGGGSSVSYYLNGSVSQGTFVGNTYYEMNKTPVIGTGTDFTINANGYIAQFITDANDPASLLIPAGNWNVEMYFSASSSGGTPSFYVEVYKYNGTTFTLLGSSATTPEGITNGTAIDIYYTSVGIPETVLTITDRLAIRVYVTHSGRTITLHTEDNHLSEIVTTFSNGLTALNGLTKQAQYFAVGSTGTDFAIVSSVDTHTFNLPTASASNRGALSSADWSTFNGKQNTITLTTTGTSGAATFISNTLNIPNYGSALTGYVPYTGATQSVDLGTFDLTSRYLVAAGASALGGVISMRQDAAYLPKGNGYSSIASSGILFDFYGYTGVSTYKNFSFRFDSLTNNTNRTYTLPDASGTLALTSDIHSAVTLSAIGSTPNANGATLTGQVLNLQPASASFGGVVTTGTQSFAGDKTFNGTVSGVNVVLGSLSGASALQINRVSGNGILINDVGGGGNASVGINNSVGNSTGFLYMVSGTSQSGTGYEVNAVTSYSGIPFIYYKNSAELFKVDTTGKVFGSGATLTGALSGTSATFSDTTDITANNSTAINLVLRGRASDSIGQMELWNNAKSTRYGYIAADSTSMSISSTQAIPLTFGTNTTTRLTLDGTTGAATFSGDVAVGNTSQARHLDLFITAPLDGKIYWGSTASPRQSFFGSTGAPNLTAQCGGSGGVQLTSGATSWSSLSDERLKNVNSNIDFAIDKLMTLNAINFSWKYDDTNKENIGLIAQEIEKVFPQVIDKSKLPSKDDEENIDETEYLSVRYTELIPVLVKAIQELKAEIDLIKGIAPIEPIAPEVTPEPIIPTDNNLE